METTCLKQLAFGARANSPARIGQSKAAQLYQIPRVANRWKNGWIFGHGVLIWQTVSFLLQPDVSLKKTCLANLRVRERIPCPQSRPVSARETRLPWRGDPSGHPASMAGRATGHAEAAGRRVARALRHSRPPFVMTRNSFEGCRARSRRTSATVLSGCRAHIHSPSDRATIIAAITFRSHRRVKASSW